MWLCGHGAPCDCDPDLDWMHILLMSVVWPAFGLICVSH